MPALTLCNLEQTYPGHVRAVNGLNLEVEPAELMVVVGPSGCGKTTMLRMIAGLEQPDRGTITLGGRVVNGTPARDRDVAMVFQSGALYPHLSVYENIAFALRLRRSPRRQVDLRVREAAEMLGLGDLLARRPAELSGGQRQRVALGRAIVRRPALLLLDEPLSQLDARLKGDLRAEIKALQQRLGATMLYVTHDQAEAMMLGRRVAVMNKGRLHQVAEPATVYEKPADRFVAGFLGTPAMNFFNGRIESSAGEIALWLRSGAEIRVPPDSRGALMPYCGREVIVGIRPEDMSLDADRNGSLVTLAAQVELVEPLGGECCVHLRSCDERFVVRSAGPALLARGDVAGPAVRIERMVYFDVETGQRIV